MPQAQTLADRTTDSFGLAVTTSHPEAVRALDRAIVGLASHRADTLAHIADALRLDPGLTLAHVLTGFAMRLLARIDMETSAQLSARRARASIRERGATLREELLTHALERWLDRDALGALAALDRAIELAPLDLLATKLCHALQFLLGRNASMRRTLERALPTWHASEHRARGWVMGCYAFALEECGDFDRAEREGRSALAIEPEDPWGAHAVAHVLHSVGRPRQGLAWLDEIEGCLAGANNFAGHVHWHRALFLCALGRHEEALALHDARVAIYPARDYRDLVNSATLLYRLERAGLDVSPRWEELVAAAIPRADDHLLAFADVHYVLVLASAGEHERAASMVSAMRARALEGTGAEASTLLEVGVPVAEAIACAHRDPARTLELLMRHEADLSRLGGSRAQREIFSAVLADASSRIASSPLVRAPGMLAA